VIWTTLGVGVNKIVQFATINEGLRWVLCEKIFIGQQRTMVCVCASLSTVLDRQAVIAQKLI
jgi:hypothetical protein